MGKERPNREELERLYTGEKLSAIQIAKGYGVNFARVYKWMKGYEIKRRTKSEAVKLYNCKRIPGKNELKKLKNIPIKEIAIKYGINQTTARSWLDRYDIKRKKHKKNVKRGSWQSLEFTLEQAKLFLEKHSEYEELPSAKILSKKGYITLGTIIVRYHGGFPVFRQKLEAYMRGEPIPENPTDQPSLLEQYIEDS
ncbi:hypothetical protein HYV88_02930 [Candidatus Woesearchaeota archaeon]|nr:hypothetical protein [Candidatus Woesearchaeota archaeon]